MFITELKRNLYAKLTQPDQHVLLLCGCDVDSVCATKILISLFRCDKIHYSVAAVNRSSDLEHEFITQIETNSRITTTVLINCGATLDLPSLLRLSETAPHISLYIIDSRRPLHIANLYNECGDHDQIHIVLQRSEHVELCDGEESRIPQFEQVYFVDEDGADDENLDPQHMSLEQLERRERRRLRYRKFEDDRAACLHEYGQFAYHSNSSAALLYETARQVSKDTPELLWWSVLGITAQYLVASVTSHQYRLQVAEAQAEVMRVSRSLDLNTTECSKDHVRLSHIDDEPLCLPLYRRWSLFESIQHCIPTTCALRMFCKNQQYNKLKLFLAEMGYPLAQARQQFASMGLRYQHDFREIFAERCRSIKYGHVLGEDVLQDSFEVQIDYGTKYAAADVAFALLGLLELGEGSDSTAEQRFLLALDALSREHRHALDFGLERAKVLLKSTFQYVTGAVKNSRVRPSGYFLQATLELDPVHDFHTPGALQYLGHALLNAYISEVPESKRNAASTKSLILIVPKCASKEKFSTIVGLPPLNSRRHANDSVQNLLGAVFATVAQEPAIGLDNVVLDNLDSNVIEVHSDVTTRFLQSLRQHLIF